MQPDSRHAKAPELRPRIFASPQTTDARWLPIHLHALSSTHRSEEHTSELQSRVELVCRLLLEKKKATLMTKRRPGSRFSRIAEQESGPCSSRSIRYSRVPTGRARGAVERTGKSRRARARWTRG